MDFIEDAFQVGFTVDELVRAETILHDGVASPFFRSTDYGPA
jgi:hypothetical protein